MRPDSGEIRIKGRRVNDIPPQRRSTVVVFQDYALFPHLSVFANIAYGLRRRHVNGAEVKQRVRDMLALLGLTGRDSISPLQLSGGQQQRVALARALVVEPDILLLDEPLSNLDANLREEMRFEIRRVHEATGITMVYVTHDQSEALVIADRVAVMNAGRIEQVGTPEDIYERPATLFVASFIGRTNALEGRLVSPDTIEVGGHCLRATPSGEHAPGESVFLCVRPQQLVLANGIPPAGNAVPGRIRRQTYLGEARDYVVELEGELLVRVLAPGPAMSPGDAVTVVFPPEACRIVRG